MHKVFLSISQSVEHLEPALVKTQAHSLRVWGCWGFFFSAVRATAALTRLKWTIFAQRLNSPIRHRAQNFILRVWVGENIACTNYYSKRNTFNNVWRESLTVVATGSCWGTRATKRCWDWRHWVWASFFKVDRGYILFFFTHRKMCMTL